MADIAHPTEFATMNMKIAYVYAVEFGSLLDNNCVL